ncbi:ORF MSV203 hypothetical protein [Melanoplus sanguinipes entomopoxvirus]|uniref:Uncharacterized protein n=1 Tax=Melanoplus sanguinipes entomopoxvirus TaxID=83191 RepID=Q9YVN9_MSEPV|nr:ORF MSV203 hypothetical protein [Melanoplus sanguinipes entomopoxvirus]AAC97700.1 ORF MSV203 hypothetical protein [Melanoplus sanguinipes entomopoxvirus 'O']
MTLHVAHFSTGTNPLKSILTRYVTIHYIYTIYSLFIIKSCITFIISNILDFSSKITNLQFN